MESQNGKIVKTERKIEIYMIYEYIDNNNIEFPFQHKEFKSNFQMLNFIRNDIIFARKMISFSSFNNNLFKISISTLHMHEA